MLWRLVSFLLLLTISTGNMVASFSYFNVEKQDTCCQKVSVSQIPSQEKQNCSMACCAQGKSPIGSPVSKLCCSATCGQNNNGEEPSSPENNRQVPSPNISCITIALPNWSLLEKLLTTTKFLEKAFLYLQPSELYLQNSALLI